MNNILSTALQGLNSAISRVDKAAHNIASSPARTGEGEPDSMIEDIVDIKSAKHAFKANLAVLKTTGEMQDELIRILDTKA